MASPTITEFVDPTSGQLSLAWRSVLDRTAADGIRQVNFIPCEVVLCLCASELLDHSRFGSTTAHRAPFPVQELARLFKRPPSSILAKMANLDGSRANGGRHDTAVSEQLLADRSKFEDVYRRILRSARDAGIGAEQLPDFLELLDPRTEPRPQRNPIRWFEGVDGQIILDGDYIWITREGLSSGADFPHSTEPRRAPVSAVLECRLTPATEGSTGSVHVLVDGADLSSDGAVQHPDSVAFDLEQAADFAELARRLGAAENADPEPVPIPAPAVADRFLDALDRLEGVGTLDEIITSVIEHQGFPDDDDIREQLADELDCLDVDPRITWVWVDERWIAAGGSRPVDEEQRMAQLDALMAVTQTLTRAAGTRQLAEAIAGTALSHISTWRFAQLWEEVAPAPGEGEAATDNRGVAALALPVPPVREAAAPPVPRPASVVELPRPDRDDRVASKPQVAAPGAAVTPPVPAGTGSAAVGKQWRVYLDCEGFRTIAVCDPATGATAITRGELEGRRFASPDDAAAAVIERHRPGGNEAPDGWTDWVLHDGSGRSLGSVRSGAATMTGPTTTASPAQGTPAERGFEWFLGEVAARGGRATRVMDTRRTAVRITVSGSDPVIVRVKTRTAGTWQAVKTDEDLWTDDTGSQFWAFVDLSGPRPGVFIVSSEEVADGIRAATDEWVSRDPRRKRTGHHAIEPVRVRHGHDRWDLLGLRR